MTNNPIKLQKPLVIMAICLIGFINATQLVFMVISPVSRQLGAFYPYYFALSALMSFISIVGLWYLKRWAALIYSIILISNQMVLLSMGLWEFSAVLIPLIILILLFKHKDEMT